MLESSDDRTKPDAVRRQTRRALVRWGTVRPVRPALEFLEARRLLSGDLYYPLTGMSESQAVNLSLAKDLAYQTSNDLQFYNGDGGAYVSYDHPRDPYDPVLISKLHDGGSPVLTVYNSDDAGQMYAMKTMEYSYSRPAGAPDPAGTFDAALPAGSVPAGYASAIDFASGPRAQVTGTLAGPGVPAEFRVPINPASEGFRLGLTSMGQSKPGLIPYFSSISVYDQYGKQLAEVNAGWESNPTSLQSMLVALGKIDTGWTLVIRVEAHSSATDSFSNDSDNAGHDSLETWLSDENSPYSGQTSYLLTIEQYTSGDLKTPVSFSSPGQGTTTSGWSVPSSSSSKSSSDSATDVSSAKTLNTKPSDDASELDATNQGAVSTVNVRIPTGPLVSRGGTAFSGILSDNAGGDDSAPSIEWADALLAASLDSLGLEIDSRRLPDPSDLDTLPANPERTGASDSEFIVVGRTPGNLPLVVSESTGGMLSPEQAAAFFATLPAPTQEVPVHDPTSGLANNLVPEPKDEQSGWSSTALGLAIGLTLGSGAYLPSFLSRLRKSKLRRRVKRDKRAKG